MNLRSKSMLPKYIYIYKYTNIYIYIYLYLEIALKKTSIYINQTMEIYIYICIFRYAYTHICIYIYISKQSWQSGSTEKYSVEALCARSSLLRVNSILSYISNYPIHIYIHIIYNLQKSVGKWVS